jgi:hypothetical protein
MLAVWYPTLLSGFAEVQGGLGDSRLVNFTLEHSYRWLVGLPLADDFWSPPIYYPASNVATYTDLMLAVAPLYWPWRILGAGPHTAYQLWMLACWSLNFLAWYLLLRRGLRVTPVGASIGAYLFAFASVRLANLVHQQLNPQFLLVVVVMASVELVRDLERDPEPLRDWLWIGCWFGGLVLQLYTAVYPLVYFMLGFAAVLVVTVVSSNGRRTLHLLLRRHAVALAVCAVVAAGVAAPAIVKYLDTADALGVRQYSVHKLPVVVSWLLMGRYNLLYGSLHDLPAFRGAGLSLHQNGVGLATTLLCILGLWHARRNRMVQLMLVGVAALFLLTLRLPGDVSLWWAVRSVVPGAAALRAVARVGTMGVFPLAIGLAVTADRLAARRHWIWVVALLSVVAVEQIHRPLTFDKRATEERIVEIAALVPTKAETFLLVSKRQNPILHGDAAWVALATGVPTINGRYGNSPQWWQLRKVRVGNRKQHREVVENLELWISKRGLDAERVAWVEVPTDTRRR